nr:MAM and LDL-receptor class A domain-containing protein 1-like [Lytechinus pictus]
MTGDDIGELNVYLRNNTSNTMDSSALGSRIWSLAGNRGDVWRGAEAEINTPSDFNIIFEVARGSSYNGDVALDDILITSYGCPGHHKHVDKNESSVSCTFEEAELCAYVQDDTDTIDWKWHNRAAGGVFTGPDYDHTKENEFGFYLYISSSRTINSEDVARIMSPVATSSSSSSISSCVEFWYHMWGRDVETLNVYIKPESSDLLPSTPVTRVEGDQGNYWHRRKFTVPAGSGEYRIVFEGIPGDEVRDDIAMDDVTLYQDQNCPEFVTEPPNSATMPPARESIDCDFEKDFCDYTNDVDTDYGDWTRRQAKDGSTSTITGPKVDHTLGTDLGYYTSFDPYDLSGARYGDTAVLKSPFIVPKPQDRCLVFFAFMFGHSIDYLTLQIVEWGSTPSMDPQFAIYGNHAEKWMELGMDVPASSEPFQVIQRDPHQLLQGLLWSPGFKTPYTVNHWTRLLDVWVEELHINIWFVGTIGTSRYASEIVLDDIALMNGKCPIQATEAPPVPWAANCDFESTTDPLCGYANDDNNDFDWTVHSGSTSSSNTGPSSDHTTGTAIGHYAYVESSIPHRPNSRITIRSPILNSKNQDMCIRFYYHAYGKDVGSLTVDVDLEDFYDDITQFAIAGDHGNKWRPANVNIPASFTGIHNFRIEFSTEKYRDGFEGDVAIDDILFLRRPCEGYPSESACSFEQGLVGCGYSVDLTAQYQWKWYDLLALEEPPLNSISSSFMYTKAPTPNAGYTAELFSAVYDLHGRTHCLTVDVVLTGDSTHRLLIQTRETEAKIKHDIGLLSGDLGGSWVRGNWSIQGDLIHSTFQLVFTAMYDSSSEGIIAIDNVYLSKHMDTCMEHPQHPVKTSSRPFISRQPHRGINPNVGMIITIVLAVLVFITVAIIGGLFIFKYRKSSLKSFTVGYKNENLDSISVSGVNTHSRDGGNEDSQVVIRGTSEGPKPDSSHFL